MTTSIPIQITDASCIEISKWISEKSPAELCSIFSIVDDPCFVSIYLSSLKNKQASGSVELIPKFTCDDISVFFDDFKSRKRSTLPVRNRMTLLELNSDSQVQRVLQNIRDGQDPSHSFVNTNISNPITLDDFSAEYSDPFASSFVKLPPFDGQYANCDDSDDSTYQTLVELYRGVSSCSQLASDALSSKTSNLLVLANKMHEYLLLSCVTRASDNFDCLFFHHDYLQRPCEFISVLHLLSHGNLFSRPLEWSVVQSIIQCKQPVSKVGWLEQIQDSPVPFYMILICRFEVACWYAFLKCRGLQSSVSQISSISETLSSDNCRSSVRNNNDRDPFDWGTDDDDDADPLNTDNNNVKLESVFLDQKETEVESEAIMSSSPHSLKPCSIDSLVSSSAIASIGCIIEDLKFTWRSKSRELRNSVINLGPSQLLEAVTTTDFDHDGVIDRIILSPLPWSIEDDGERVKLMIEILYELSLPAASSFNFDGDKNAIEMQMNPFGQFDPIKLLPIIVNDSSDQHSQSSIESANPRNLPTVEQISRNSGSIKRRQIAGKSSHVDDDAPIIAGSNISKVWKSSSSQLLGPNSIHCISLMDEESSQQIEEMASDKPALVSPDKPNDTEETSNTGNETGDTSDNFTKLDLSKSIRSGSTAQTVLDDSKLSPKLPTSTVAASESPASPDTTPTKRPTSGIRYSQIFKSAISSTMKAAREENALKQRGGGNPSMGISSAASTPTSQKQHRQTLDKTLDDSTRRIDSQRSTTVDRTTAATSPLRSDEKDDEFVVVQHRKNAKKIFRKLDLTEPASTSEQLKSKSSETDNNSNRSRSRGSSNSNINGGTKLISSSRPNGTSLGDDNMDQIETNSAANKRGKKKSAKERKMASQSAAELGKENEKETTASRGNAAKEVDSFSNRTTTTGSFVANPGSAWIWGVPEVIEKIKQMPGGISGEPKSIMVGKCGAATFLDTSSPSLDLGGSRQDKFIVEPAVNPLNSSAAIRASEELISSPVIEIPREIDPVALDMSEIPSDSRERLPIVVEAVTETIAIDSEICVDGLVDSAASLKIDEVIQHLDGECTPKSSEAPTDIGTTNIETNNLIELTSVKANVSSNDSHLEAMQKTQLDQHTSSNANMHISGHNNSSNNNNNSSSSLNHPNRHHTNSNRRENPFRGFSKGSIIERKLTRNIKYFNKMISANNNMEVHRCAEHFLLHEVKHMASILWPHSNVEIYGSSVTGLALPWSDIDLVIQCSQTGEERDQSAKMPIPQQAVVNGLMALTSQLYMQPWAAEVHPIPSALVPVIKFQVLADILFMSLVPNPMFALPQDGLSSPSNSTTFYRHSPSAYHYETPPLIPASASVYNTAIDNSPSGVSSHNHEYLRSPNAHYSRHAYSSVENPAEILAFESSARIQEEDQDLNGNQAAAAYLSSYVTSSNRVQPQVYWKGGIDNSVHIPQTIASPSSAFPTKIRHNQTTRASLSPTAAAAAGFPPVLPMLVPIGHSPLQFQTISPPIIPMFHGAPLPVMVPHSLEHHMTPQQQVSPQGHFYGQLMVTTPESPGFGPVYTFPPNPSPGNVIRSAINDSPGSMPMMPIPVPPVSPALLAAARGIVLPVDISIEAGEHKGRSTCEFIRESIQCRSSIVASVIKVIKTLLYQTGNNVPFNGGLSSYATFLMVCTAYDTLGKPLSPIDISKTSMLDPGCDVRKLYDPDFQPEDGSEVRTSYSEEEKKATTPPRHIVRAKSLLYHSSGLNHSEGALLLHFFRLFSRDIDPSVHGIGIGAGAVMSFFELTPEIKLNLGTSCWISDPLDPSKNAARPCFSFRAIQQLFGSCLHVLENDGANFIYAFPSPSSNSSPGSSHFHEDYESGRFGGHKSSKMNNGGDDSKANSIFYSIPDEIDLLNMIIQY